MTEFVRCMYYIFTYTEAIEEWEGSETRRYSEMRDREIRKQRLRDREMREK